MADIPISSLTALGAAPATNDLLVLVDVSDTTQAPTGTTKKMTTANLFTSPHMTGAVVDSGGLTVTLGGLTVTAGGLTVSAGATAVQALTATTVQTTGNITGGGDIFAEAGSAFRWPSRSMLTAPSDGVITVFNNAQTGFTRLNFGGVTSSFPALKRSTTTIAVRLADDSADAGLSAAGLTLSGTLVVSGATATLPVLNGIGGLTSSFPALKRNGANLQARLGDDSDYGTIEAYSLVLRGQKAGVLEQTGVSVSTSATDISSPNQGSVGGIAVVAGTDGTNRFVDIVAYASSVATALASQTGAGAPAARTYTAAGGSLRLAMASGSYTVGCADLRHITTS